MDLANLEWTAQSLLPDTLQLSISGYDHSPEWGLIISGGYTGSGDSKAVVKTKDGSHYDHLPDMPEGSYGHCLTIIDENRLLVAGGFLDSVHIFDAYESQWKDIGPFPSGGLYYQYRSSCGIVKHPVDGRALQVVIAGAGMDADQVDIFELETNEWKTSGTYKSI